MIWSNEVTALLMRIVMNYKSNKCTDGFNWDTISKNYEEILQRFCAARPEYEIRIEHYPNNLAVFTKKR